MSDGERVTFEQFRREWLVEIEDGALSTVERGHRFAHKLLTQWLDSGSDDSVDDLIYCDGSGDGGIDIAFLDRGDTSAEDGSAKGDTWYLVQSKYGTAFQGASTLFEEGRKVIDTFDGQRKSLSSLSSDLLAKLNTFRASMSDDDQIVLLFATVDSLNDHEKLTLTDLMAMGRARLGARLHIDAVCVETVYQRAIDYEVEARRVRVSIKDSLAASGSDLLVGSTPLVDLYEFLRAYRSRTGDLDQLYEKNVRRFLGGKGKVNKAIQKTLQDEPERFGLYNNGITIVVTDFVRGSDGTTELVDPYVVNGCQTTRVIWEVCSQRLGAGGTGSNIGLQQWHERLGHGVVVTKVARVGSDSSSEELLRYITRYTNSQNAVREKDFVTLTSDFRSWADAMGQQYGVFLEIQRGGWESRKALQKQKPDLQPRYADSANAFDLIKVFGAGWLSEAGLAFRANAPFLPNGAVFKAIVNGGGDETFSVHDLYAAYRLRKAADQRGFGRGAQKPSRRQTRFLYYLVVLDLLKGLMTVARMPVSARDLTRALLKLFHPANTGAAEVLLEAAAEVVDEYLTDTSEMCAFKEPSYGGFANDLNAFLKSDKLGKDNAATPLLHDLLVIRRASLGYTMGGGKSPKDLILDAVG